MKNVQLLYREYKIAELILVIDTSKSSDLTFNLPAMTGFYAVDYGDGTPIVNNAFGLATTYTFAVGGIYTVSLRGKMTAFNFGTAPFETRKKLIGVNSWSGLMFITFSGAFNNCINLENLPLTVPKLNNATTMTSGFANTKVNQSFNNWDFSNVTNLNTFLSGVLTYDKSINWNTFNVNSMNDSFYQTITSSIKLNASSLNAISLLTFRSAALTELILTNMSISFSITFNTLLLGAKINDLANSVKDMTGLTSPTITMTPTQKTGADLTLWTDKNWIVA